MNKEHPILFSTAMVQALLAGRKTQTRRIIKTKYSNTDICWKEDKYGKRLVERQNDVPDPVVVDHGDGKTTTTRHVVAYREIPKIFQIGDLLWVREEHYVYGWWKKNGLTKTGKQKWNFVAEPELGHPKYFFNGGEYTSIKIRKNSYREFGWYKRLARFMPKKYARIFLEVTDVRVERIQDITEDEAILEGVLEYDDGTYKNYSTQTGMRFEDGVECLLAVGSFTTLINKVNGPGTWDANPWVRVISFKVLSTTGKPANLLQ